MLCVRKQMDKTKDVLQSFIFTPTPINTSRMKIFITSECFYTCGGFFNFWGGGRWVMENWC